MKAFKLILFVLIGLPLLCFSQTSVTSQNFIISQSNGFVNFPNTVKGQTLSVALNIAGNPGNPTSSTFITSGCFYTNVCTVLDKYTGNTSATRTPSVSVVYDYFQTQVSWSGGNQVSASIQYTVSNGNVNPGPSASSYKIIGANGILQVQRPTLNFISGSNATVNCSDNALQSRTDCIVTSTGGGSLISASSSSQYTVFPATSSSCTTYSATGTQYCALNNLTGNMDFTSTDLRVLWDDIIGANLNGGRIFFKNGVYNCNSFDTESTGGYTNGYCIGIPPSVSSGQYTTWVLEGESWEPDEGTFFAGGGSQNNGVILQITSTALNTVSATKKVMLIWARPDTANNVGATVYERNLTLRVPDNQRGCETESDLSLALNADYEDITTDTAIANGSISFPVETSCTGFGFPGPGVDPGGLIGVTTTNSGKQMTYMRNVNSWAADIAIDVRGEHVILDNVYGNVCNYAIQYGVRGSAIGHLNTFRSSGSAECARALTLGSEVASGNELEFQGFDMEDASASFLPAFQPVYHAADSTGNAFGKISYMRAVAGAGISLLTSLFDGGGGGGFSQSYITFSTLVGHTQVIDSIANQKTPPSADSGSPAFDLVGTYENSSVGPTYAPDTWSFASVISTALNGDSYLTVGHNDNAGTPGSSRIFCNIGNTTATVASVCIGPQPGATSTNGALWLGKSTRSGSNWSINSTSTNTNINAPSGDCIYQETNTGSSGAFTGLCNNSFLVQGATAATAVTLGTTDPSFGSIGTAPIPSACETNYGITTISGAATTNTGQNCLPANSVIDAVVYRITTTITTATSFTIGDSSTAARFCSTQSTLTAGTTGICFAQTGTASSVQASAASVRVTPSTTPGAGAIRIIVYYHTWTAPTS